MASAVRIADAHNDLLLEVAWRRGEGDANPLAEHWLPKLEQGGVALQVCRIFVELDYQPEAALRKALILAAAFFEAVHDNSDRVHHIVRAADLEDERIGLILSLEGVDPLGSSPELIDVFWELGVRMVGLTWQHRNAFADGNAEPAHGGLSRLGKVLVERLVELGAIIDLAHASERTFWDLLERSGNAPVAVSHACCRALHDTPRNLSDEQMQAIAERGGLLGVMALPPVVDPERPELGRFVDHVDHAVGVMGIEHVALGADFVRQVALSGAARLSPRERRLLPHGLDLASGIEGLTGPEDFPNLVAVLRERGYVGDALDALAHGNLERFLREALP